MELPYCTEKLIVWKTYAPDGQKNTWIIARRDKPLYWSPFDRGNRWGWASAAHAMHFNTMEEANNAAEAINDFADFTEGGAS